MRLEGIELLCVSLPLIEPWRTAAGAFDHREVLLVRVVAEEAEGWGECVAMAEPTYTAEYVGAAIDVLRRHLVPRLLAAAGDGAAGGRDVAAGRGGRAGGAGGRSWVGDRGPFWVGGGGVGRALEAVKGHRMAKAALELAVLDAELRAEGRSFADRLMTASTAPAPPVPGRTVPAGVAIGLTGSVPALLDAVGARVAEGYRRVKLKIEPGWDVEPVQAVRRAFGDDLALQVDANGSYRHGPAERLEALDSYGLLMIEQPLGDDDLVGHAALASRLATPICLDESITSADSAASALALGACSVVNIKAGRVGGYLEAVRVHDRCAAAGVPVWCGGMLETGVGRAANLALASLPNFSLPGDLSGSDRFWRRDLTEPLPLRPDGTMAVPDGPGLGVTPLPEVVAGAQWREWWPLPGSR